MSLRGVLRCAQDKLRDEAISSLDNEIAHPFRACNDIYDFDIGHSQLVELQKSAGNIVTIGTMGELLRVEFHCHTIYSKDSLTHPETLMDACRRKGIDRVIITDHNTIAGARAAQRLDPERVIAGEEVMTARGEILAAFVVEEIPPRLSPAETIKRLREQGAFISVSHPFDSLREGSWRRDDLLEILPLIDAIEVFNSRCIWPRFNHQAEEFAREHNIPGTVGSDAHAAFELGRAILMLPPFEGPMGLRAVIRQGIPQARWSPPWFHLTSRYAAIRKKIKFGLDTTN